MHTLQLAFSFLDVRESLQLYVVSGANSTAYIIYSVLNPIKLVF